MSKLLGDAFEACKNQTLFKLRSLREAILHKAEYCRLGKQHCRLAPFGDHCVDCRHYEPINWECDRLEGA